MIAQLTALCLSVALAAAPAPEPTPAATPTAEPPPPVVVPPPPPTPPQVDPRNYNMVLAGDVVIGLGGVALVSMAVGLGLRADALAQRRALGVIADPDDAALARQDDRVRTGTILAISGGAAAAALFATGITLVAVGYKRERKRREALAWLPSPSFARGHVGLRWSLQF